MTRWLKQNPFLKLLYFDRSEVERLLVLSAMFSVGLLLFRAAVTGDLFFFFLGWNLFLAFIPYAMTEWISRRPIWMDQTIRFIPFLSVWLLFIPNSFYILTDLFHLNKGGNVPRWFDLSLILSFAWNGLILGLLSVRRMEVIISSRFSFLNGLVFVVLVMALNALGIYIGRYLRFNSWDILTSPFSLAGEIVYLIIHPLRNLREWGMIFSFTILLVIMYEGWKRTSFHDGKIKV